jgi:predicted nucleotidyltransferase
MTKGPETQVLLTTLKRIAKTLKEQGVPFALSGSFAAYARGAPPSFPAHDVDFVLCEEDVGKALAALEETGMTVEEASEDWLAKARDGDTPIDLIHRPGGVPVSRDMLERATPLMVESVLVPVLDATDLLVMRLRAFTEHECDFSGPLLTVRALREQADWDRVEAAVADSPYARAFLFLLRELDVIDDTD